MVYAAGYDHTDCIASEACSLYPAPHANKSDFSRPGWVQFVGYDVRTFSAVKTVNGTHSVPYLISWFEVKPHY